MEGRGSGDLYSSAAHPGPTPESRETAPRASRPSLSISFRGHFPALSLYCPLLPIVLPFISHSFLASTVAPFAPYLCKDTDTVPEPPHRGLWTAAVSRTLPSATTDPGCRSRRPCHAPVSGTFHMRTRSPILDPPSGMPLACLRFPVALRRPALVHGMPLAARICFRPRRHPSDVWDDEVAAVSSMTRSSLSTRVYFCTQDRFYLRPLLHPIITNNC